MAQRSAASPFAVLSDLETRALAASRELPKAHGLEEGATRYIGFRLGQTGLVASMHEVIEILPYPELTGVPGSAPWLRGISQIRGRLLSVVDLSGLSGRAPSPVLRTTRMLIVKNDVMLAGLVVDEVFGLKHHSSAPISSLSHDEPAWLPGVVNAEVEIDGTRWGVLSVAGLLSYPDFVSAAVQ